MVRLRAACCMTRLDPAGAEPGVEVNEVFRLGKVEQRDDLVREDVEQPVHPDAAAILLRQLGRGVVAEVHAQSLAEVHQAEVVKAALGEMARDREPALVAEADREARGIPHGVGGRREQVQIEGDSVPEVEGAECGASRQVELARERLGKKGPQEIPLRGRELAHAARGRHRATASLQNESSSGVRSRSPGSARSTSSSVRYRQISSHSPYSRRRRIAHRRSWSVPRATRRRNPGSESRTSQRNPSGSVSTSRTMLRGGRPHRNGV